MELSNLTAKSVRNLMKKGYGLQDFCSRYNCTAEDLRRALERLWSRDQCTAHELISQMKDNDKKRSKRQPKNTDSEVTAEDVVEEQSVTPDVEEANSKITLAQKIEAMRAEEDRLSAKVMGIESHHKRLAEDHRCKIMELRRLSEEIRDLKALFKTKCSEYKVVVDACNKLGSEMNQDSEERRICVAELEALRQRIEGLNVLDIGVYSDGTIEVFNHPDLELDYTGFEAVYDRIRRSPECRELKVREVETLAQLMRAIEIAAVKVNLVFDSEDMELAYMLLTEST